MVDTERKRRSRRWVLVAGGSLLAGCSLGYQGLDERTRTAVLDAYAAGLAARGEASEDWIYGTDAWERHFFRVAARRWRQATDGFGTARASFRAAADDCLDAGLTDGAALCTEARRYCSSMHESAAAHADAADAYAAGEFTAGDRHLESGFDHYITALDHGIPPAVELETALSPSR